MSLGEDFRTHLLNDPTVSANVNAARVHQNRAPTKYQGTYIWYRRAATADEPTLDETGPLDPFRHTLDVEIVGKSLDAVQTVADAIRSLARLPAAFGNGTIKGLFIKNQNDDYLPRGILGDVALHWAAVQIEIAGYSAN